MIFQVLSKLQLKPCQRLLSAKRFMVHEPFRSGHEKYEEKDIPVDDKPLIWHVKNGYKILRQELSLLKEEVKEHFQMDPKFYNPGDTDIFCKLNSQEELNKWIVTSDKMNDDGFSDCKLTLTKHNHGLFHGVLDKRLPKDGRVVRAGYCNITILPPKKSFNRDTYFNWDPCTHLVFRIRGDGRTYAIVLQTAGYYDVNWHDTYTFNLYTRGGPYWQFAKVPFSMFILSSKGYIQDTQGAVMLSRINGLGITCADRSSGPFHLEIDYIGVHWDPNHSEEFAYEMYHTSHIGLH